MMSYNTPMSNRSIHIPKLNRLHLNRANKIIILIIAVLITIPMSQVLLLYVTGSEFSLFYSQNTNSNSQSTDTTTNTNSNSTLNDNSNTEAQIHPSETPVQTPQNQAAATTNSSGNWWSYPSVILPVTRSGDDLLVLVNKTYKLSSAYVPSGLTNIASTGIRTPHGTMTLRNIVLTSLTNLNNAAKSAGVDLSVISSYRSYATQVSTYNYWVSYNGNNVNAADQISARPGHSQHQLGTAVDFSTNEIGDQLGDAFSNTNADRWLTTNAWKYGFALSYPAGYESITGYAHESWHYRYIGEANATEWHNSGQILEMWLEGKN